MALQTLEEIHKEVSYTLLLNSGEEKNIKLKPCISKIIGVLYNKKELIQYIGEI